MYLDFYQFNKAPFLVTPDPEFLFLSPSHQTALGAIAYGIENRQGFVLIVGEVGVGKTTILRSYLERVDPQLMIISVLHSNVTFTELLKIISRACDLQEDTNDIGTWLDHFQHFLLAQQQQRRNVVLIIDEAQGLPLDTLEQLHLLSNLGPPRERLLQIVLAGQSELKAKLQREELQHVGQNILIRVTIFPLTREESRLYIYHRIAKVTDQPDAVFTPAALQRIVRYARGVPQVLNILCTNALIAGYGLQQKPIGPGLIEEVIMDVFGKRSMPGLRLGPAVAASVALLGLAFWLYTARERPLHDQPLPAMAAPLALPHVPEKAATPDATVLAEAPSPLPWTAVSTPEASANDRQVPTASGSTTDPQPQPTVMGMPLLPEEDRARGAPQRTVEPDEQSPRRQPSASHAGTRYSMQVQQPRVQNPSKRWQASTVSPGAGSGSMSGPGRRPRATAQMLSANRPDRRVVPVGKTGPQKAREAHQYDSRGLSMPSPYSQGDDTGSSW